jgi:aminoglycoside phosphotransferase (APT) family kinase protein
VTEQRALAIVRRMDEDDLDRVVRQLPWAELLETRPLAGGVSSDPRVLEVRLGSGELQQLVVREHPRAATEFRLLGVLREGGLPVPRPVLLDEPLVVTELLAGETWPTSAAPAAIPLLARLLLRIHAFEPRAKLGFLRSFPSGANDAVLLHGDFWPGNVLWRNGAPVAVVDWQEAVLGDPLADVGNCRLELLWALGAEAVAEFTGAYRELAPDLDYGDLSLWDVRAVDRLLPGVHLFDPDEERQAEMRSLAVAFRARAQEELSSR